MMSFSGFLLNNYPKSPIWKRTQFTDPKKKNGKRTQFGNPNQPNWASVSIRPQITREAPDVQISVREWLLDEPAGGGGHRLGDPTCLGLRSAPVDDGWRRDNEREGLVAVLVRDDRDPNPVLPLRRFLLLGQRTRVIQQHRLMHIFLVVPTPLELYIKSNTSPLKIWGSLFLGIIHWKHRISNGEPTIGATFSGGFSV